MAKDFFDNFDKIKVGDRIYTDGRGPCSGGAPYGLHEKVVATTKRDIIVDDGAHFSRKTGNATTPPWAYYISYWRKKTVKKKK